jgi:phage tail tape-measure protein
VVKQNCLNARRSERQRYLDQGRSKRVGRAMAIGCAISGIAGAGAGAVGGGIVGVVTGPAEPLVGVAGAVVGGILGCTAGALTGGFAQLTIGEYLERRDTQKDAANDDSVCERQANAAVKGQ